MKRTKTSLHRRVTGRLGRAWKTMSQVQTELWELGIEMSMSGVYASLQKAVKLGTAEKRKMYKGISHYRRKKR